MHPSKSSSAPGQKLFTFQLPPLGAWKRRGTSARGTGLCTVQREPQTLLCLSEFTPPRSKVILSLFNTQKLHFQMKKYHGFWYIFFFQSKFQSIHGDSWQPSCIQASKAMQVSIQQGLQTVSILDQTS